MQGIKKPFIFGVYGTSNSGKTTLVSQLIKLLSTNKIRCASIKLSDKQSSLDSAGKDSWVHGQAGADPVVFSSIVETVFFKKEKMSMQDITKVCSVLSDVDVIIVEGAQEMTIPKVRIGTAKLRENTVFDFNENVEELVLYITQRVSEMDCMDELSIKVNGKEIVLTEFPRQIIINGLCGMLSSLKGVKDIESVELSLKRK